MLSVVIPVYRSEGGLLRLLEALANVSMELPAELEVVFVVDGSPDNSLAVLRERLVGCPFRWQLASLSRNFGAWQAIAAGLRLAEGDYIAVMAADLQEPPELMMRFHEVLSSGRADVVIGRRDARDDPWFSALCSAIYWSLYRRYVVADIPPGGMDVFAVTREVRDIIARLEEASTSLVALIFWIGFRREFVDYSRAKRLEGRSAWTFAKKVRLAVDSVFNFSDLPLRLLLMVGGLGAAVSFVWGSIVLVARLLGVITVPGYAAVVVAIGFFGGLTTMGLGILGQYLWLVLQNVRRRPNYIIASRSRGGGEPTLRGR